MSYNSMLGSMNNPLNLSTNLNNSNFSLRPSITQQQYDPNYQKIMMPNNNPYFPPQNPNIFPNNFNSSSIALFHIPNDATNSLYVDGVPNDTNEREVSHIFRPFPGFQCIRLIRKTANNNRQYYLCFVDFQNALQSTIAMNTLQGYRFDKHDKIGLKISYANQPKEAKQKRRRK